MDFAVSFPARGVIHLKSRALFQRRRPSRIAAGSSNASSRPRKSPTSRFATPTAELRYCPETHRLDEVVSIALPPSLNGHPGAVDGQVKGTDGANGQTSTPTNG